MKTLILILLLPGALSAQGPPGCDNRPAYRQFDFWVGEWNVSPTGINAVAAAGTSSIHAINKNCAILENWTGSKGGNGKSLNFYNASTGKWQQIWTDAGGGVTFFTGAFSDNAMRFEGESVGASGAKAPVRLTFYKLDSGQVRQVGETSSDGGKTWAVTYDLTYTRR